MKYFYILFIFINISSVINKMKKDIRNYFGLNYKDKDKDIVKRKRIEIFDEEKEINKSKNMENTRKEVINLFEKEELKQELMNTNTNIQYLNKFLANFPYDAKNDLKVAPSITGEKDIYAVNKDHYKNILTTILTKNNGITRLFYRKNDKMIYYTTINIIKHRPISKEEKDILQKKHPKWSPYYNWNYLIEFNII